MNRQILLTGGSGQVGWELRRTLMTLGNVTVVGRDRLDLASAEAIATTVRAIKPELIVNAAGYTAVDSAESESALAMAINGVAPGILAEEAKRSGALLVHYSTDYVFDGEQQAAYAETDRPNPLNVYGATKLAGENAIRDVGATHLIFRTSWVYGARGKNFLRTIRRLAAEREELSIVDDQVGGPTWSRGIAEATAQALAACFGRHVREHRQDVWEEISGIYHLSAAGATSWYGFALAILSVAPSDIKREGLRVTPIPAAEYRVPATRPKNSLLSNAKFERVFGLVMPDWKMQLDLCLEEMK